jgi:hypothetical protein
MAIYVDLKSVYIAPNRAHNLLKLWMAQQIAHLWISNVGSKQRGHFHFALTQTSTGDWLCRECMILPINIQFWKEGYYAWLKKKNSTVIKTKYRSRDVAVNF